MGKSKSKPTPKPPPNPTSNISDSSVADVLARLSSGLGTVTGPQPRTAAKDTATTDVDLDDGGEGWEDDEDEGEVSGPSTLPAVTEIEKTGKEDRVDQLVKQVEVSKIDESGDDDSGEEGDGGVESKKGKKKKKKKKGKKAPTETPSQTAHWLSQLSPTRAKQSIDYPRFPDPYKRALEILYTPGCHLSLRTSLRRPKGGSASYRERKEGRVVLRAIQVEDLGNIVRIKCDPVVNSTQMYGNPAAASIGPNFLFPYIAASMPATWRSVNTPVPCRSQYCFAITLPDPPSSSIKLLPPPKGLKSSSALKSLRGYLGNIALKLEVLDEDAAITALSATNPPQTLLPEDGRLWKYPTRKVLDKSGYQGKMYYELHPQLWNQGLMSEAFHEIVRFAFEDVGVSSMVIDPREGNTASIKLAESAGFVYTHRTDGKQPQLWYKLERGVWLERNGYKCLGDLPDKWGGRVLCRWCNNMFMGEAKISCTHCDWGKWCSRECQLADWVYGGPGLGHRDAGGACPSADGH